MEKVERKDNEIKSKENERKGEEVKSVEVKK